MAGGMRMIMVVVAVMLVQGVTAKTLTVGDTSKWTLPPSTDFYSSWAAKQSFAVGDVLVFDFPEELHTVAQLNDAKAYEDCDASLDPKAEISTSTKEVTLAKEGTYYFICTVGTHCVKGQKLSITVPSKATTDTTSTSESSSNQTSPSPSPHNSALRVSGFPVSFIAMVMSLVILARVIA